MTFPQSAPPTRPSARSDRCPGGTGKGFVRIWKNTSVRRGPKNKTTSFEGGGGGGPAWRFAARRLAGGLVEHVVEAMQAHIRAEGLAPGDVLPSENAFASELNVSRAVVREAFRSMAALKLIDIGNGRRARVSAMDKSVLAVVLDHVVQTNQITVQQILDVRRTVELRTVALAALRRSERRGGGDCRPRRRHARRLCRGHPRHGARHRLPRGDRRRVEEPDVRADRRLVPCRHPADLADRLDGAADRCRPARQCRPATRRSPARFSSATTARAEAKMAEHFDNTVKVLLAAGIN